MVVRLEIVGNESEWEDERMRFDVIGYIEWCIIKFYFLNF